MRPASTSRQAKELLVFLVTDAHAHSIYNILFFPSRTKEDEEQNSSLKSKQQFEDRTRRRGKR